MRSDDDSWICPEEMITREEMILVQLDQYGAPKFHITVNSFIFKVIFTLACSVKLI